jgi:hypothetical protein
MGMTSLTGPPLQRRPTPLPLSWQATVMSVIVLNVLFMMVDGYRPAHEVRSSEIR